MVTTSSYKSRQAGSLATFLIVGVLLLGLALGGVYAVKQRRGAQIATNNGNETAQIDDETAQEPEQPAEENGQDEEQPAQEEQPTEEEQPAEEQPEEQPAEEEQPAQEEQPAEEQDDQEVAVRGETDGNNTSAPSTGPHETPAQISSTGPSGDTTIPETGPAEQIMTIAAGFAAITLVGLQYRRSKKNIIEASINAR